MRIRHRLSLAFFLISVVPLAVVTAYGYYSSASALRRAAEVQADQMAEEMGQRMTWVLADLGDRVQRIWQMRAAAPGGGMEAAASGPRTSAVAARPGATAAVAPGGANTAGETRASLQARVHQALAEAAPMIEHLDFVPAAPGAPPPPAPLAARPAQDRPPRSAPPPPHRRPPGPGPVRPPDAPAWPTRIIVTTPDAGAQARAGGRVVVPFTGPSRESIDAWTRAIQQQIDNERRARGSELAGVAADNARAIGEARTAAREAGRERRRLEFQQRLKSLATGEDVRFAVQLDGAVVGEVNAKLNRHRMIETVLGLARRERGEVPFVLDIDDEIHTTGPEDARTIEALKLDRAKLAALPGQTSATVGDWVVVTRHDESGIVFGIARPLGEGLRDIRMAAARSLGLGLLLIVAAFAGIAPLASRLTRHVTTLTDGVQRLARGERGTRVSVQAKDEVGELAAAFNRMAGDLEAHEKILVEQERLRRELELCRQIQNDMLPHGPLRLGLAEVTGVSIPAREVGGDFFNYFALGDGTIALLVGDVSGKGVGAALLMANIQATLRARLPLELNLPTLVDAIDRDVADKTPAEVYLTLFVAILDPVRGVLRYVNAGHNTQFLLHGDGGVDSLEATGLPVGLLPGRGFEQRTVRVSAGDLLFLYTDGATEVENEAGEMFGADRLQRALAWAAAANVSEVLASVESTIAAFRGAAEPSDDATMMAVSLGGGSGRISDGVSRD
jgi:serine phosphatase RsbU (regulator of sigma subunit)